MFFFVISGPTSPRRCWNLSGDILVNLKNTGEETIKIISKNLKHPKLSVVSSLCDKSFKAFGRGFIQSTTKHTHFTIAHIIGIFK